MQSTATSRNLCKYTHMKIITFKAFNYFNHHKINAL